MNLDGLLIKLMPCVPLEVHFWVIYALFNFINHLYLKL